MNLNHRIKAVLFLITALFCFSHSYSQTEKVFGELQTNWLNYLTSGKLTTLIEKQYNEKSYHRYNHTGSFGLWDLENGLSEMSGIMKGRWYNFFSFYQHDSLHYFEVGRMEGENKIPVMFVIGWTKQNGKWIRELDLFYDNTATQCGDIAGVELARHQWIQMANDRNPKKLVKECYTNDATHLSAGKLSSAAELPDRYAIMGNNAFSIHLEPYDVMVVQKGLIFEIGQYQAGHEGLYFIIWQKQANTTWKVMLDFNF